jgi:hypothetical protein
MMKNEQVAELLYQALETEKGGIQIYETALKCVVNDDLRKEWEEYLEQTRNHEQIVLAVMEKLGLDPETETPGREVVRHIGESLVKAMDMALENAQERDAAQVVAAYEQVEEQEDEHLYHTAGWGRELWIKSLGMPAVLPPPEEEKEVKSAIGAARAKMARKRML